MKSEKSWKFNKSYRKLLQQYDADHSGEYEQASYKKMFFNKPRWQFRDKRIFRNTAIAVGIFGIIAIPNIIDQTIKYNKAKKFHAIPAVQTIDSAYLESKKDMEVAYRSIDSTLGAEIKRLQSLRRSHRDIYNSHMDSLNKVHQEKLAPLRELYRE